MTMNEVLPGTGLPTTRSTVTTGRTAGQSPPRVVLDVGLGVVGVADVDLVVVVEVAEPVADPVALAPDPVVDGVALFADAAWLVHAVRPSSRVSSAAIPAALPCVRSTGPGASVGIAQR